MSLADMELRQWYLDRGSMEAVVQGSRAEGQGGDLRLETQERFSRALLVPVTTGVFLRRDCEEWRLLVRNGGSRQGMGALGEEWGLRRGMGALRLERAKVGRDAVCPQGPFPNSCPGQGQPCWVVWCEP